MGLLSKVVEVLKGRDPNSEPGLLDAIREALVSRRAIPTTLGRYVAWARELRVTLADSLNHGIIGWLCDLLNLVNGKPTIRPAIDQRAKATHYGEGEACGNEAFSCSAYLPWDLDGYRVPRELYAEMGEPDVAASLHVGLRSSLAHLALGASRVQALTFSDAELAKDGPRCFVADSPPRRQERGLLAVTCCGARSANDKVAGTAGKKPPPGAPTPMRGWTPPGPAVYLTDALSGRLDKMGQALKARGRNGQPLTDEERAVFNRALDGDWRAIRQLVEWAAERRTHDTFRFLIFEGGPATLCMDAHESSTAASEGRTTDNLTGEQRMLVANIGHRDPKGGADTVGATTCRLNAEMTMAYARRVDKTLPEVSMSLPGGKLLLDFENNRTGHTIRVAPWLGHVEPPPVVVQPPPARRSWWQRLLELFR